MSIVERAGVVSLWAGRFATEELFYAYVEKSHADGRSTSGFLRDSGIGFYDEDFAEGSYAGADGLDAAIRALSYGDGFHRPAVTALRRLPGVNAVYAIYDIDATGLQRDPDQPLVLVGTFPYRRA